MMKYVVIVLSAMIAMVGITAGFDQTVGKHRVSFTDKIDATESDNSYVKTIEELDGSVRYQTGVYFDTAGEGTVCGAIFINDGQKDAFFNVLSDKKLVANTVNKYYDEGGYWDTTLGQVRENANREIDGKTGYISRIEATVDGTDRVVDVFVMSYKDSATTEVTMVMAALPEDRQIIFDILNSLKIS
jgi:hypothetical protein